MKSQGTENRISDMNVHHKEIREQIKRKAKKELSFYMSAQYSGSSHKRYGMSAAESRELAKEWAKKCASIPVGERLRLLDALYGADCMDEKQLAGRILLLSPETRKHVLPNRAKKWLLYLEGWEEIDSLCQSVFSACDMLEHWTQWEKALLGFAASRHISHRRASLAFLTAPVRQSRELVFADLAFQNIERLQHEKDILITKAVSWLLRELIANHRERVAEYIARSSLNLPKIALRETRNKLQNGRK